MLGTTPVTKEAWLTQRGSVRGFIYEGDWCWFQHAAQQLWWPFHPGGPTVTAASHLPPRRRREGRAPTRHADVYLSRLEPGGLASPVLSGLGRTGRWPGVWLHSASPEPPASGA